MESLCCHPVVGVGVCPRVRPRRRRRWHNVKVFKVVHSLFFFFCFFFFFFVVVVVLFFCCFFFVVVDFFFFFFLRYWFYI